MKLPLVWLVVLGGCLLTDGAAAADPSSSASRRIFIWKDLSLPEYAGYTTVPRLYETQRDQAARRAKIEADSSLTPEMKAQQLRSINDELQRLLTDLNLAQRGGQKQP